MRICLIGLPRSGSQHIVELIQRSCQGKLLDCSEPFTFGNSLPSLECSDGLIVKTGSKHFVSVDEHCNHVLDVFNKATTEQDVILRLFLTGNLEPLLPKIVATLKKQQFQFFSLKRENIEDQLLSFAIAKETDQWNTVVNNSYANTQPITIKNLQHLKWLYDQIIKYDNRLSSLDVEYQLIRYEHAIADLTTALAQLVSSNGVRLKKQITGDPYNMIANATEIKEFIKTLINGTQIY